MSKVKKDPVADKVYTPGDIVLAKVKGYPAWPGHVIDNDMAPPAVKREKPPKDKSSYLVQFFPTGDYSWTKARDISTLSPREIAAYVGNPGKKNGDLLKGYKIAEAPSNWIAEREESDQLRADEAARAAEQDTEDQLASGDEANGDKSKKRKRKSDAGAAKKEPEDKKAKKAKLEKLAKSRAGGAKKSAAHSDDEAPAKKSRSAPADDEDPGLKQVKDWRHKLQKVFLGKTPVAADELVKCKEYFDSMEKFVMTKEWLAESKLGKVLKRIAFLAEEVIPNGDEFGFRTRSQALAQTWSSALGEPKGDGGEGTPAPTNGTPAVAAPAPDAEMAPPAEEPKPVEVDAPAPAEVEVEQVKPDDAPALAAPVEVTVDDAPAAMEVDAPEPAQANGTPVNGDAPKVDEPAPEAAVPAPVES